MKKQMVLIAALMMSTIIYAQHGKHREDTADKMRRELSLNDTQFQSIKAIDARYHDKYMALRKDSARSRDQKMESTKALRSEQAKEMTAVLTPDQNTKWQAYRKTQAEKGRAHMEKAGQKYEEKVKTDLSLNDEQFAKFKKVNQDFKKEMSAIHKSGADESKRKEAFVKAKSEHEAAVKSLLSEEQFQKWTKLKVEHKKKSHHRHG